MRRVRAEWEKHKAVMVAFPHADTDWAKDGDLERSYAPFLKTALALAYSQPVYLLCRDRKDIEKLFCSKKNISFIEIPCNDTWVRDYGPISAEEDTESLLLDFRFDGWGGKYAADLDNAVNKTLHKKGYFGTVRMETVDFVLEGGSIESDGAGTIMTTSICLCNPGRNGGLGKKELEKRLGKYLGARRVLWLDHGYLAGDDTDGHIDMLARFTDADTITYLECTDRNDEHYDELKKMKEQLQSFRTVEGKPYRLVPLPMCEARYDKAGRRLPASYANFLISSEALLYPAYGDKNDKRAGEIFAGLFPDREIMAIPCSTLIEQGGSLHCSTMQINY